MRLTAFSHRCVASIRDDSDRARASVASDSVASALCRLSRSAASHMTNFFLVWESSAWVPGREEESGKEVTESGRARSSGSSRAEARAEVREEEAGGGTTRSTKCWMLCMEMVRASLTTPLIAASLGSPFRGPDSPCSALSSAPTSDIATSWEGVRGVVGSGRWEWWRASRSWEMMSRASLKLAAESALARACDASNSSLSAVRWLHVASASLLASRSCERACMRLFSVLSTLASPPAR
mmetsp:Transcript_6865/g.9302  ORF Transcript_6865/g.9302 Transcript_6865/m.9302 type:complete len:239 (+) Transcript_6865:382-1098(+)